MKSLILSALSLCIVSVTASAQKAELKTQIDSVSYSIGLQVGENLKQQSVDVNPVALAKGIEDAIAGTSALSPEQVQQVLMAFQQQMMDKMSTENRRKGEAFLAENKAKKGIVTLPSGLQYEVVQEGKGKKPAATDEVTVHYTGKLVSGKVFDSSVERGEPTSFKVDGVIKGWTEGLQLMKEGSKYRLFVPANLAYGEQGAPPVIGPNEVLVFDVELIKVGAAK